MKETIRNYLRLGRAQTYPADWLLVLVPFITGVNVPLIRVVALSVFMFFIHIISFGENSLLDFTQGYDKVDPSKDHHPLSTGAISVPDAMSFIHWGKALLATVGCVMMFLWSPNPVMAILGLFLWYAWGTAYNVGLSKTSLFGFLPICLCFTAMGGFGWYLSHEILTSTGWWYLAYTFTVILFQISWSGHLKEMDQAERSNLLIAMGARLQDGWFRPGWSALWGVGVKALGTFALFQLLLPDITILKVAWFVAVMAATGIFLGLLCPPRDYNRPRELKRMSFMEIVSIYAPIPLMIPWQESVLLMLIGVTYFIGVNKMLWGVSYPKV